MSRHSLLGAAAKSILAGFLVAIPVAVHAQTSASAFTYAARYDGAGRITGTISPDPDEAGPLAYAAVRNTYDVGGRLIKVEQGQLSSWQSESVAPSAWGTAFTVLSATETDYDGEDRKTKEVVKGSDGAIVSVTQYSYDLVGRLQCTAVRMDPAQWGLQGNVCVPQLNGPNGADRITKNEYDAAGQLVQVRRGVGTPLEQAYATYTYTLNGKQEYVIDANGNRAQMVYDGFDRLSSWIFPSKTAPGTYAPGNQAGALSQAGGVNSADYEQYSYDANGNRLTLRKRDGSTLSYTYDALNRVTRKVVPERSGLAGAATRDVYYAYDLQGNQTDARFDSLSGEGLHATFDGLGREISNTLTMDNVGRSVSYQYDANSNRTMATQPDGAFARYAYDGLDRLKQAWWGWAGVSGEQLFSTVGYKANGLRDTIARGSSSTAYGYDNAQRLSGLSQNFAGGTGNLAQTFVYNPAAQMTREGSSSSVYTYKSRVNVNRAYGVNGLNQYSSIAGRSFCYDANGSLTADGTFVYLYDVENRLVEKRAQTNTDCSALAYAGSIKASLRYDPMGRLYETVGDVTGTTRMAYDGDKLIGEYNAAGNLLRRYLWGDRTDEPLVWDEGGLLNCSGTRFLAGNHQGSIVATADCQGNLTRTFAYDEYGIPEAGDATPLTPANGARFLYTGQAFQPDLGMYYYKARMYSPTLGRFMQTDPIGYDDQINLYAYVQNDPVNETDPTGMCPQCIGAAFGAATGAGLDYGVQVLGNLADGQDWGDALTNIDGGSILLSATGGAIAGATGVGAGALVGKALKAERAAIRAERAVAKAREGVGGVRRAMRTAQQARRAQQATSSANSSVRRAVAGAAAIKVGQQAAKQAEPKKDDSQRTENSPPPPPPRSETSKAWWKVW